MRLDSYLVANHQIKSREKAKSLILEGKVKIEGRVVLKPAFEIEPFEASQISIDLNENFVSRAGKKLLGFLEQSDIICKDKFILDVGSSSGGFAQVLLKMGVAEITCVDVGSNQLDLQLRENPKIKLFEQCDIREFIPSRRFDLAVCDVSFISLRKILPSLLKLSDEYILLFKPQFEVGKEIRRSKKGVILDNLAIEKSLEDFKELLTQKALEICKIQKSILKGKEGNEEYFFHIRKS